MIQIRLRAPCAREFEKDVYRPGVISLTRLLWGSLGGGLALAVIALLSITCGLSVLYPPLAATCFLNAACPHLRVARPRPVIVGHLVSSVAGVLAVAAGQALHGLLGNALTTFKLSLAVGLATLFMQIFDADHPPAAATAAIPAILPLPVAPLLLPLHMAWGAVIAVVFALLWNRIWFVYPPPESDDCSLCWGLYQPRLETIGLGFAAVAALFMGLRCPFPAFYDLGLSLMSLAGLLLMFQHFHEARIVSEP